MENKELTTKQPITDTEIIKYLDVMGLAKLLTDNEKAAFIQIAKLYQLNPFKREIYAVKYKEGETMSIVTGYEVYLKRAERQGPFDGCGEPIFEYNADGSLKSCTVTVHRKDRKFPTIKKVFYSEYVQMVDEKIWDDSKKQMIKTGRKIPNKFWQKGHTMLEKVAIAQAFRAAFPDEMGGMPYTSDELPETVDIVAEVTNEKSNSETVKAEPIKPTEQPAIDNHVHAVNALKKCITMSEVLTAFRRMTLEVQSRPVVQDERNVKVKEVIEGCKTVDELADIWKQCILIYAKGDKATEMLSKVKDEMKKKLSPPEPAK